MLRGRDRANAREPQTLRVRTRRLQLEQLRRMRGEPEEGGSMKHKHYKPRKRSILERLTAYFNKGIRWIVKNPRYTKKHKQTVRELFALSRED